ncbi:hypothetical protein D3C78_1105550 [compost metagenome]
MDFLARGLGRQERQRLIGRIGKRPGKSLVPGQQIGLDVPDKGAQQGPGVERQAHSFVIGAVGRFGLLAQPLGRHVGRGLHDHRQHPGRHPVVIGHRAVIEVHEHRFGLAVAQQFQLFIAKGQRATGQAGVEHLAIELGDFRPAELNRRAEQVRMPATGKHRIGVVVDHVAGLAPEQHQGNGRGQQQLHRTAQARRPGIDAAQFREGPVERTNTPGHFTVPATAPMTLHQKRHRLALCARRKNETTDRRRTAPRSLARGATDIDGFN